MDTPQPQGSNASTAISPPTLTERLRSSKALIPTLAVMGVTVMALAATLVVNRSEAQPGGAPAVAKAPLDKEKLVRAEAFAKAEPGPEKAAVKAPASTFRHAPAAVAQAPKVAVCNNCGTVESVVAVQRQGQVNGVAVGGTTVGLGTVAGGVVGGLLGNQVGGGSGKTAMTVLGVAGGAFAGNAIEHNMKKVTSYQMRVRMNNGSMRTIEQASAVQSGSRVVVEGNTLRLAPSVSSSSAAG
ncbi:glycine zipper 2TM domain-containing protein [Polaromonas sp.]|uniref:glycine zipper 2TM domain-containing protein n=1 Tax=Polaromonas sp. TaxID=1869339 RepID=UPI001D78660D|nr:glycine zipper 2TM domain-containing protein [Polaromonas sp.]MBT9476210.1 glycine zipper 2TM domain-containing protein [Polaromonas sp.]